MNEVKILSNSKQGEGETVEFKKSTAELKEAVISIVAMLNKHGQGKVYFGIADNDKVLGQAIGRRTLRDITQSVVDNTEPKIFPKVEVCQINGKDCIVVEAHGTNSPYFAETMYKFKDIERWGSGLKRIHEECVATGTKVDFKRLKTGFVVIFYRPKWEDDEKMGSEKTVEKTELLILDNIKSNPQVTIKDLQLKTGLSRRGVEWQIQKLKESRKIKRIGPDRGGHWKIK